MKNRGKALLFFSSYLPCWVIYSLSQGFELNLISFVGISLTVVSLITLYIFKTTYETATRETKKAIRITKISNGSSEVVSYLVSLVVPVATSTIPFEVLRGEFNLDIMVTVVLSFTIFLIYINSNLVVINPVLVIFGYSLYLIDYKISETSEVSLDGILITKKSFNPEDIKKEIILQNIDKNVFLISR